MPPQLQGVGLQGQVASFKVAQSPEGKLQARALNFRGAGPAAGMHQPMAMPGMMPQQMMAQHMGVPPMGAMGGMQPQRPQGPSPRPQMGAASATPWTARDGQRFNGVVHNYNFDKGFGFLKSPSIPADVYFKGQGDVCQPGTPVVFTLRVTPDGKPQANAITVGVSDGQTYVATVSSYSPRNGYGFFTIPDGLGDVYFKKTSVPPELQEADLKGMHASVQIKMTPDGKPQCVQAQFLDGPPPGYVPPAAPAAKRPAGGAMAPMAIAAAPAAHMGVVPPSMQMGPPQKRMRMDASSPGGCNGSSSGATQATGMVTSYNAMKGFGFIQSQMAPRDVYFKRDSLPMHLQQQPMEGKPVAFLMVFTPDGKPQAQNVQLHG